jgi:lambda family phage holin
MFEKFQPEHLHGAALVVFTFLVSIMTTLRDKNKIEILKQDLVESTLCALLGFAGFAFILAMGWNIYFSYVLTAFIGSLGSKEIKRLASKIVKERIK